MIMNERRGCILKKFVKSFAFAAVLLSAVFAITVNADFKAPSVTVSVNDKILEFDVAPVIEEGRTLIPIRAIFEQLDYDVVWDSANSRVEIKNNDDTLELFIGRKQYLKNGLEKQMDVSATVTDGRTMVPLRLVAEEFGCTVRWLQESCKAEIVRYETVRVTDARELLEAIGSRKRIVLSEGEYNLSKVEKRADNDFIEEVDCFDGTEYSVIGVKDLIIEGEEGKKVTVLIEPRYANVLFFAKCENVTLKNLTVGHTTAQGYCLGGVVSLEWCDCVNMESLHLYGCGTYGVKTEHSINVNVKNSEIYECTYGLTELSYSQNVIFDNCVFRDTEGYDMFYIDCCENVKVCNGVIKNNKSGVYSEFIGAYNSSGVRFENCDFEENAYFEFATEEVIFENCRNNNGIIE